MGELGPDRRRPLPGGTAVLAVVALLSAPPVLAQSAAQPGEELLGIGPLVGGVTDQRAVLWVQAARTSGVDFLYSVYPDLSHPEASVVRPATPESFRTVMIGIDGLIADTRYYYTPRIDGRPVFAGDYPSFLTAPPGGVAKDFDFVFLTDFNEVHGPGSDTVEPMTFRSAAYFQPAFTLIGGDFDHRDPGGLTGFQNHEITRVRVRRMYAENLNHRHPRRRDLVGYLLRRGGLSYLWDDHDYCCNDSDGTFTAKHVVLGVYDEFFPSHERPRPDDGIYRTWRWGQAQFFLLDGRFNRSPSARPDDADKTLLGTRQKKWFKDELAASTAIWKFVLSGSVFNPTVKCGADNWCEYRTEGLELTNFIRDRGIENVIFLSGDIHAGAITDGTNSVYDTFWEMASPGPDVVLPMCDTTLYQGPDSFGEWTHGSWGQGFGATGQLCWGFGHVAVRTNPHRVHLTVRDQGGLPRVSALVAAHQD